ncbi:aldehyde dehydrogenase [Syntrophotalea acetylenivorans]|uniref:Aldehyde dehydrogenase n=1 Tax=Syntrophotalea acetylenivorans TaxID=1842532 RepID=A0A1L3GM50_9BACT|nr:aldehyde dehydrogenase family protein [Syntrophotalea acetylenivorans]APG26965.1 aldehyde dehydrogenase [Syntrophotalea acetylenivorans]
MTRINNYIGGEWVLPSSGEFAQSVNPARISDIVTRYPLSAKIDVDRAVAAAREAYPAWRDFPAPRRAEILYKAAEMLQRAKPELGKSVTREMGKVSSEGLGDIQEAIDMAYYMAGEGRRLVGETVPCELPHKDGKSIRVPHGVFALITPWNFPVAIPVWKIFASLICGNTAVFKPSSDSPYCAALLVEILEEAGLPPGVLNLVMGQGKKVGEYLATHPDVDGISFTGSCAVGETLAQHAAVLHRPIAMEMGGKNAILILKDADLDLALHGVLWGAFGTTGQRCTAASRIILEQTIYDRFLTRLIDAANALRLGDGLLPETDVGPLINAPALDKVMEYIRIGQEEGAELMCGGERADGGSLQEGYFMKPAVFANARPGMRIVEEEIFGPVVAVMSCADYEEGIRLVNQSRYGLSTSIYTNNVNHAARAEGDLDSGLVYINASTIGAEIQLPFGGFKHSGSGHPEAGGRMGGIDFYSRIKVIYRDFSGRLQKAQISQEST